MMSESIPVITTPLEWTSEKQKIRFGTEPDHVITFVKHLSVSAAGTFEVTDMQDREPCRIKHFPRTRFGDDQDSLMDAWLEERKIDSVIAAAVAGQEIGYGMNFDLAKVGIDALISANSALPQTAVEDAGFSFCYIVGEPNRPVAIYRMDVEGSFPTDPNYMQLMISDHDVHLTSAGDDEADNGWNNLFRVSLTDARAPRDQHETHWTTSGASRKDAMLAAALAVTAEYRRALQPTQSAGPAR